MPRVASSAISVPPSGLRKLANAALRMEGVLKLFFGESNLPTPEYIKRAACKALEEGYTFYTENAGLIGLRTDLADYYRRMHGVNLDPETEIVITASGVQALNVGIRCTLDAGDEALLLTPSWPNATSIVRMFHAVPFEVPLVYHRDHYGIDFEALESAATERTRLLVYTSPSNPIGWVATEEEQERILEFARRRKLWLLADEVYERLYYRTDRLGGPAPSILRKATREDAVMVTQSFSKSYCMTGWRVGWLVTRRDAAEKAVDLNEFIISHAPSFVQRAAQTALSEGETILKGMIAQFRENRDFCLERLRRMPGVTVPSPDGAFYLFPRIEGLSDSFDFCLRLLRERKVGLAPGAAFGRGGEGSVRLCYASDHNLMEEAMNRFERFLADYRRQE